MKYKINSSLALAFSLIILLLACDPADNRLNIVNNSNSNIYLFYSCDSSLADLNLFRNGYYKNSKGDSTYSKSNQYLEKNTSINIPRRGHNAWVDFFKNCKNGQVHFYIFTDSVVCKYSDVELKEKALYVKHFKYTLEELKQNNWTVKY